MEVKPSDLESPKAKIKETKSKKPLNLYNDKPQVQHAAPVHRPTMGEIPDELRGGVKDVVINVSRGKTQSKIFTTQVTRKPICKQVFRKILIIGSIGFFK